MRKKKKENLYSRHPEGLISLSGLLIDLELCVSSSHDAAPGPLGTWRASHPAWEIFSMAGDLHFWYHRFLNERSGDGDFWGVCPPAMVVFLA